MDAKKCDRCGRFYEEYGEYKATNAFEYKVKKNERDSNRNKNKSRRFHS